MNQPFNIRIGLIRRRQIAAGLNPCYSDAAMAHCNNKDCCWRAECYSDDSAELLHEGRRHDAVVRKIEG